MKTYNVIVSKPNKGETVIGFNGVRALTIARAVALSFNVRKRSGTPKDGAAIIVDLDNVPLFTLAANESLSIRATVNQAGTNEAFSFTVTRAEFEATKAELISRGILRIVNETEGV